MYAESLIMLKSWILTGTPEVSATKATSKMSMVRRFQQGQGEHSLCSQGSEADVLHQRLIHAFQEGSIAYKPLCVADTTQHPEEAWHGQWLHLKALLFWECWQCHLQQQCSLKQDKLCSDKHMLPKKLVGSTPAILMQLSVALIMGIRDTYQLLLVLAWTVFVCTSAAKEAGS